MFDWSTRFRSDRIGRSTNSSTIWRLKCAHSVARAGVGHTEQSRRPHRAFHRSLVRDFRQRAGTAPMVPGVGGQRNFTPLLYQLSEQENREISLPMKRLIKDTTWWSSLTLRLREDTTWWSSLTLRLREDTTRPNTSNSGRDEFEF